MQFVGHHCGSLANAPEFSIVSPPTLMTFFGEHFVKTKPTVELTPAEVNEIEIRNLNRRIENLQNKLKDKDRLLPFARDISKKLRCLGEMSHAEMFSAGKFGIDVKFWEFSKNWSFRRPTLKYDEETYVDNNFLRANGELKEYACASVQFPRALQNGLDIDSTILLHKVEDDLFSLESEACDWREFSESSDLLTDSSTVSLCCCDSSELDPDALDHDIQHYTNDLKPVAQPNETTETIFKNDGDSTNEIQRLAIKIIQNTPKSSLDKNETGIFGKKEQQNLKICPIVEHEVKTHHISKRSGPSKIPVRIKSKKPEIAMKQTVPTSKLMPAQNGGSQNSSQPQPQQNQKRPVWRSSYRV